MSEETKVEQVEHKTEIEFKEKKLDKAKGFIKKHKKKLIAGGVAAVGTVAAIVGVKHFGGLPDKTSSDETKHIDLVLDTGMQPDSGSDSSKLDE